MLFNLFGIIAKSYKKSLNFPPKQIFFVEIDKKEHSTEIVADIKANAPRTVDARKPHIRFPSYFTDLTAIESLFFLYPKPAIAAVNLLIKVAFQDYISSSIEI